MHTYAYKLEMQYVSSQFNVANTELRFCLRDIVGEIWIFIFLKH